MVMIAKKKVVLRIAGITAIVLLVCMLLSRTISTMLLPQVELTKPTSGQITTSITAVGNIDIGAQNDISATSDMKIVNVLVKPEQAVKAGDVLFEVDTSDSQTELKRLELNLVQKQNLLTPQAITPEKRAEIEMRLHIAEMELELFRTNVGLEAEKKQYNQQLDMVRWRQKSLETREQLQVAIAELNQYSFEAGENFDYAQEQRLRLAVLQASNNLLLMDPSQQNGQKNAAQLEYEAALREYEQFTSTHQINTSLSEEKLLLSIVEYQNQLNPAPLTAAQRKEYRMQIDIAQGELNSFKASLPKNGKVLAAEGGLISSVAVRNGEKVIKGKVLAEITPSSTAYSVVWHTSLEAGEKYGIGSNVSVALKRVKDGHFLDETVALTVDTKKLDDNGQWKFTAKVPADMPDVSTALPVEIRMMQSAGPYNVVIPRSCLQMVEDNKYVVYSMRSQTGLFGIEDIVEKHDVKIVYEDSFEVAVESTTLNIATEVIRYASKPISEGTVISKIK